MGLDGDLMVEIDLIDGDAQQQNWQAKNEDLNPYGELCRQL